MIGWWGQVARENTYRTRIPLPPPPTLSSPFLSLLILLVRHLRLPSRSFHAPRPSAATASFQKLKVRARALLSSLRCGSGADSRQQNRCAAVLTGDRDVNAIRRELDLLSALIWMSARYGREV
ncbi:hypothetical protein ABZP36_022938 [Zizania latifolia]